MGCDIHFTIETKHNNTWVGLFSTCAPWAWAPPWELREKASPLWKFANRNYAFFAQLAGVRSSVLLHDSSTRVPNGIPRDISELTRMGVDYWGNDGHSHSHLPLREFVRSWLLANPVEGSKAVTEKMAGKDPIFHPLGLDPECETDALLLDNARVVFWFDN